MWVTLLCLGILLLSSSYGTKGFSKCQQAMLCVHNGLEKCGEDHKTKEFRRFLDWCDIKEYNCLFSKDFAQTTIDKCENLPPLDTEQTSPTPFETSNPLASSPSDNDPSPFDNDPSPADNDPSPSDNDPSPSDTDPDPERRLFFPHGKNIRSGRQIDIEPQRKLERNNRFFNVNRRIGENNQVVRRAIGIVKSQDKSTDPSYKKVTRRVWLT